MNSKNAFSGKNGKVKGPSIPNQSKNAPPKNLTVTAKRK